MRIAELKAKLSEHPRAVRSGETLTVLDRETPIAQIVPVHESGALKVRLPEPGTPRPNRIRIAKPVPAKTDILALLLEERQNQR